jgi:hypothetical protein
MTEVIVFPDVEATLIDHFNTRLANAGDAARAFDAVPTQRPDRFLRVMRVGGTVRNLVIDQATVVVEAWDVTNAKASDLCLLVRAWLFALKGQTVGTVQVKDVSELGGPARLPDPQSTQPRYTFTASVQTRGVSV